MTADLVGVTEIATMLGVSTQRVSQLAATSGFPEPLARLAATPVWDRALIIEWAQRTGRTVT